MANNKLQTERQNARLTCIRCSLGCITYQLLLVMVLLSVRIKKAYNILTSVFQVKFKPAYILSNMEMKVVMTCRH